MKITGTYKEGKIYHNNGKVTVITVDKVKNLIHIEL
jgi:hypothetical protein